MRKISTSTQSDIKKAAKALLDGSLVAFPTETVYGLGADATNPEAVSRVYSVKGRPTDHPLIVHISSKELINDWAIDIPSYAQKLAKIFWPGPMTLILRRSYLAKDFITGGQSTVGLRVPNQPVALNLLQQFNKIGGLGIAAPSANKFGRVSPTNSGAVVDEIGDDLGSKDIILNDGNCDIGIESTIIDCTGSAPLILRPGAITTLDLQLTFGTFSNYSGNSRLHKVSGQEKSHYAPTARILMGGNAQEGEGLIALSTVATPLGSIRLASPRNELEFAQVMYSAFRLADWSNISTIRVIPPQNGPLSEAIIDRITKASFIP
jgi:L-threonylcarbamoyladenylate synthase